MEQVGQAIDRHRLEPRIAKDHLVEGLARRVAGEGGLDVQGQDLPQFGQFAEKSHRLRLGHRLEVLLLMRVPKAIAPRLVAARPGDLQRQLIVHPIDQVARVVGDVPHVQPVAPAETRIEHFPQVANHGNDRLVIRQRAVADVVQRADLGIGLAPAGRSVPAAILSDGCR